MNKDCNDKLAVSYTYEALFVSIGQKKTLMLPSGFVNNRLAVTYSPGFYPSTIGAEGLNFSVRNGKRWNTLAITTISFIWVDELMR